MRTRAWRDGRGFLRARDTDLGGAARFHRELEHLRLRRPYRVLACGGGTGNTLSSGASNADKTSDTWKKAQDRLLGAMVLSKDIRSTVHIGNTVPKPEKTAIRP